MKILAAAILALAGGATSDPVGVYAIVEKVAFEPNDEKPERLLVWGAFRVAKGKFGMEYEPAVRGYLYYRLDPDVERKLQLAQWNDLKAAAGTGEGVSFSTRYKGAPRVRAEGVPPKDPDLFSLGWGVVKGLNHLEPLLGRIPAAASPREGEQVQAGRVTLRARNALSNKAKDLKYVFEIEEVGGAKETSEPVGSGEKETYWTPKMEIRAGGRYVWRVSVEDGEKKRTAPVSTNFTGKK